MSDELCLAIDLGTGGLKVGLVSPDGQLHAQELHAVHTRLGTGRAATQDADEWWQIICQATSRLLSGEVRGSRVKAVAVTGQWASTVPVDANAVPTGACLTWQDMRGGRYVRERIGGKFAGYKALDALRWVRHSGGAPSLSGADPIGQRLTIMHDYPEQAARTRWYLEPVDYLTMRFCGEPSATHASMQGSWLTDTRHLDKYVYDETLLHAIGLSDRELAPLRPIGSVIGTVKAEVADSLGLSENASVITGLPDLQAAALGAGATMLYATHLALSTTSWISCPVPKKKTDITHSIATVPGLSNDSYLLVNNQDTGARALEWLRGVLSRANPLSYDDLTTLAATSVPGAGGIRFSPWLSGERSPVADRRARGAFSNLSLTTTDADLVRSVLEGVAANSRWLFGYVEKFCGRELSPIRIVGGGARSSLWCQIYADALGRPVIQSPDPMFAQLRGIAAMAFVATGYRELQDLEANVDASEVFTPTPEGQGLMHGVGEDLIATYKANKPLSRRLN